MLSRSCRRRRYAPATPTSRNGRQWGWNIRYAGGIVNSSTLNPKTQHWKSQNFEEFFNPVTPFACFKKQIWCVVQ